MPVISTVSVSKFVSFVLMEVLMSQDNPITLLRIIKKYVSVIRENGNAAGSGWLSHWLELENFACYWCSEWNETIRQSSQVSIYTLSCIFVLLK